MTDSDQTRWKKLVADYEASELRVRRPTRISRLVMYLTETHRMTDSTAGRVAEEPCTPSGRSARGAAGRRPSARGRTSTDAALATAGHSS